MHVRSLGWEDTLKKEMATHWKIPWTEEPGRLQPMALQRPGQDLVTEQLEVEPGPCPKVALLFLDCSSLVSAFPSIPWLLFIQSCLTLCVHMNYRRLGFPVLHYLPEFAQTLVHWVVNAIQPSHPLSSPSPPAFNLSCHQGRFLFLISNCLKVSCAQKLHQGPAHFQEFPMNINVLEALFKVKLKLSELLSVWSVQW